MELDLRRHSDVAATLRIASELRDGKMVEADDLVIRESRDATGRLNLHLAVTTIGASDWFFRIAGSESEEQIGNRLVREHACFRKLAAARWGEFAGYLRDLKDYLGSSARLPDLSGSGLRTDLAGNARSAEMIVLVEAVGQDGRMATRQFPVRHGSYRDELRPLIRAHRRGSIAAERWSARGAIAEFDLPAIHVMDRLGISVRSVLEALDGRADVGFSRSPDLTGRFLWRHCRVSVEFHHGGRVGYGIDDGVVFLVGQRLGAVLSTAMAGAPLEDLVSVPLLPRAARISTLTTSHAGDALIELERASFLVDRQYRLFSK